MILHQLLGPAAAAATMTQSMCCLNDSACMGMLPQVDKEEQRESGSTVTTSFRERNRESDLAKECSKPGCCVIPSSILEGLSAILWRVTHCSLNIFWMPLQHPEIAFLPRTSSNWDGFLKTFNHFIPHQLFFTHTPPFFFFIIIIIIQKSLLTFSTLFTFLSVNGEVGVFSLLCALSEKKKKKHPEFFHVSF